LGVRQKPKQMYEGNVKGDFQMKKQDGGNGGVLKRKWEIVVPNIKWLNGGLTAAPLKNKQTAGTCDGHQAPKKREDLFLKKEKKHT